jgi:hypothetical protein
MGHARTAADLLSEVRHADVLANDPCTREFLQAGDRWNTQAGFLRDLAIYSLRSRLATPGQAGKAASLLFETDTDSGRSAFDEKSIASHTARS